MRIFVEASHRDGILHYPMRKEKVSRMQWFVSALLAMITAINRPRCSLKLLWLLTPIAMSALHPARTEEVIPHLAPLPPPISTPQDKQYPGTIGLAVDATDLHHHVFSVVETIPVVQARWLTLLYPKWVPGTHEPAGPLAALAGLTISARGQELSWQRDTVNLYAFHVNVPPGVTLLQVKFQYLSPPSPQEGDVVMTDAMLDLQWHQEVLYPAGFDAKDITVRPSILLPAGWRFGTALGSEKHENNNVIFYPVSLNVLIDSPVYAGLYFAQFDLAPGGVVPVHLDVVADHPEDLAITPRMLNAHRELVRQAALNFASQHYDHFDFLLSLSDEMTYRGLEHHRSSENGEVRTYFTDPDKILYWHDLVPHEYAHSWNGKFRRPSDLWSPDYNIVPERDSLLWLYEGQTEYWGWVLAVRSGLANPQEFRDYLALICARLQVQAGRTWRNLQDTDNDPIINERQPLPWPSWSRVEDYKEEMLMWLDADTLIRERTNNASSLTHFAQLFFGVHDGSYSVDTYAFEDVVGLLRTTLSYDWRNFLLARLNLHPNPSFMDGIQRAGWRLEFSDSPSLFARSLDEAHGGEDLMFSVGLFLAKDGTIGDVLWDGPAFRAGLSKGVKILTVNGEPFIGIDTLKHAISQARGSNASIELLVMDGKHTRHVAINYHGGLCYPHLVRNSGGRDRLADILQPLH